MFWGITIENGKRYTQVVDDSFHVSMAALECQVGKNNALLKNPYVAIMIEKEKSEFLLCTLKHGELQQQPLDLNFVEGEEVTFFLNGEGVVHLTGYVLDDHEEEEEEDDFNGYEDFQSEVLDELKRKRNTDGIAGQSKKRKVSLDLGNDDSTGDDSDDEDSEEDLFQNNDDLESGSDIDFNEAVEMDSELDSEDSGSRLKNKKAKNAPSSAKLKPQNVSKLPKSPKDALLSSSTPKVANKSQTVSTPNQSVEKNKKQNAHEAKGSVQVAKNADESQSSVTPNKKKKKRNRKNKTLTTEPKSPDKSLTESQPSTPSSKKGSKKLEGGVIIEDLHIGAGPEVQPGKMLQLYYVGKLQNNKEFDAVRKGEKPFRFRLGQNEVIKGWDIGIKGMRVGGRRKIIVPPQQGYGSANLKTIPPNSTLCFDVQLISVN